MGDVTQIKSIAKELNSESDAMAPFCHELVRLAENFDFDGIQKFGDLLAARDVSRRSNFIALAHGA
ncbi:MAG: hypothetical protein KJO34_18160 [Deltaproteobacteria bacterium]|nr:hypothetical protein [Deltaproteobacteria bacterium]